MTAEKAFVTEVALGTISIEGLMSEEGQFYVAVPQMVSMELVPPNRSAKQLQALVGIDFQSHKLKTEFNSNPVNAITLETFNAVLLELVAKGNEAALALSRATNGLAWQQLFSDAFGVKFEAVERQEWLAQRTQHLKQFHPLYTIWLKNDGVTKTYGTEVNKLKQRLRLPLNSVNTYDATQLAALNRGEHTYDALRRAGLTHEQALGVLTP